MSADFDARLDALLGRHVPATCPALSLCVFERGDLRFQLCRGYIDPDTRRLPVTAETLFDLASVTKLIVETAFLALVEAGEVALDDPLHAVIPEFAEVNPRAIAGGQDPHTGDMLPLEAGIRDGSVDSRRVTFFHLLTHTSGLQPWRSVYQDAAAEAPPPAQPGQAYDSERWRRGLAAMLRYPFAAPVGDGVRYSDIGIMLLGEAVARICGCRLDEAIARLVLHPLDLRSFTYNPVANGVPRQNIAPTEMDSRWRKRRAWGEVHDENACGVGGIAGHAGLFAAAEDVARFGQAWLCGDERLRLSAALRQKATREHASGQFRMGLGWMLKAARDSSAGDHYSASSYGHTGFTGTSLWIDPERQLVTALLTNRVWHGREADAIHDLRRAVHDLIASEVDA